MSFKKTAEEIKLDLTKHRQRVLNATCKVDHKSPKAHAGNFLRLGNLRMDSDTYSQRTAINNDMLMNIVGILQTHGVIDSFNKKNPIPSSGKKQRLDAIQALQLENYKFGHRILCVKGELQTRPKSKPKHNQEKYESADFVVPDHIMRKYDASLILPENELLVQKLFRPLIYIIPEVVNVRPLGRIIIQLYTEASPQFVLEFVRICTSHSSERFKFVRNFPSLWLESELQLDSKSLVHKKLEYDMRAVDHGSSAGILSHSRDSFKSVKYGFINFSISYKPLSVLNNKRIAFGVVTRGRKILDSLREYGTRNGKTTKEVRVTHCGAYR